MTTYKVNQRVKKIAEGVDPDIEIGRMGTIVEVWLRNGQAKSQLRSYITVSWDFYVDNNGYCSRNGELSKYNYYTEGEWALASEHLVVISESDWASEIEFA